MRKDRLLSMETNAGAKAPTLSLKELMYCDKVVFTLSASLDNRSTLRTRVLMHIHVLTCPGCRAALQQFRYLRRAARQLQWDRPTESGPHLHPEAVRRIMAATTSHGNGGRIDQ